MPKPSEKSATTTVVCRVPQDTFEILQLAQPFAKRRSMQDLVLMIIDEFVAELRHRDPGFEKAVVGLIESRAQQDGTLARRRAGTQHRTDTP